MDGSTVGTIAGVGGVAIVAFVAMWRSSRGSSKALGRLEGKVDGLAKLVTAKLEDSGKQINRLDDRIDRTDKRIDNVLSKRGKGSKGG